MLRTLKQTYPNNDKALEEAKVRAEMYGILAKEIQEIFGLKCLPCQSARFASEVYENLKYEINDLKEKNIILQSQVDNNDVNFDQLRMTFKSKIDNLTQALEDYSPLQNKVSDEWVDCPVCGMCDTHKETDADGNVLIHCTNHACASNGGTNHSAIKEHNP